MKQILSIFTLSLLLASCIKNDPVIFRAPLVEFDAASWNANSAGLTYPILTRKPAEGRAASGSDSTIRRYAQTIRLRVNLLGEQSNVDRTVNYETFTSPITTIAMPATAAGQTPSASTSNLTVSDAVAGTHYAPLPGSLIIPAGSSFGYIDINILNPGPTAGSARFLGIKLTDGGVLKPSNNYSMIGIVIDQR